MFMPELPEVETIKNDLVKNVRGRRITGVNFLWPGILKGMSPDEFAKKVNGRSIENIERRAKNLAVILDDGYTLLFHMKMTGHLIVVDNSWGVDSSGKWVHQGENTSPLYDPLNQYIRVIFSLDNGKILAFSDLRKFAYVKYMSAQELAEAFNKYGPEPLSSEFTVDYLKKTFEKKPVVIKKALMDQELIAGIGNIYADEILYAAKIHPLTKTKDLDSTQITAIHNSAIKILNQAIKMRGTSTSDFRDTEGKKGKFGDVLNVYRRTGLPCKKDGAKIVRITVGGRGTHFCPVEQKLAGSND